MKQIDRVLKYAEDTWLSIQHDKSEYANTETYAEAAYWYNKKSIFKIRRLRFRGVAIHVILKNDFRQDFSKYGPKLACITIYMKWYCYNFKRFLKHAMPFVIEDFVTVQDFIRKVYNVNIEMGGRYALHN